MDTWLLPLLDSILKLLSRVVDICTGTIKPGGAFCVEVNVNDWLEQGRSPFFSEYMKSIIMPEFGRWQEFALE